MTAITVAPKVGDRVAWKLTGYGEKSPATVSEVSKSGHKLTVVTTETGEAKVFTRRTYRSGEVRYVERGSRGTGTTFLHVG